MQLRIFRTEEELDEAGAELIAALVKRKPNAVLGLATGGTPVGLYNRLAERHQAGEVSFVHAASFNLDEYAGLAAGHPESYRSFMRRHLFDRIDMPADRTHIPDGNAPDLDAECRRYDERLARLGPIDLQLLGLGHNGHIGFNEPAPELAGGTHVVELDDSTRRANARFFGRPEDVPRRAVTMGVGAILRAERVVLAVKGEGKADILRRALQGSITTACPASLLQLHPRLTVLADRGAGKYLMRKDD